jgi:hypothetical protein
MSGYPLSTGGDERLLEKFHVVQHLVWLHDTPNEQKCLNNAPDGIGIRGTIRNACMRYPLAVQDKKIFIMGDNHARIITREG